MIKNKDYFDNLLKNSKSSKKQIALYLDETRIEEIDLIIKICSSISDSKTFSRNLIIEEAIDKFINDSKTFLQEEHGIDVDELLNDAKAEKYNLVIFASNGIGFEETFFFFF